MPISYCFIIPITCSVSRIAAVCVGGGDANPQKGCTNQLFGQIFLEKLHENEIWAWGGGGRALSWIRPWILYFFNQNFTNK